MYAPNGNIWNEFTFIDLAYQNIMELMSNPKFVGFYYSYGGGFIKSSIVQYISSDGLLSDLFLKDSQIIRPTHIVLFN